MVQNKRAKEKRGGRGQWAESNRPTRGAAQGQRGRAPRGRGGTSRDSLAAGGGAETECEMAEGGMLGSWRGGIEACDWPI